MGKKQRVLIELIALLETFDEDKLSKFENGIAEMYKDKENKENVIEFCRVACEMVRNGKLTQQT